MDSALRPRDIQARIRAGESPESVAEVAQVHVDKIMGYAVPVLAERQHIAERAQRSGLRRKGGDGPGRLLGDVVAEYLRAHNIDPDTAGWDAWRREDGRWTVTVTHDAGGTSLAGAFTFDALGRYVVADDDGARRLLGETPPEQEREKPQRPARRLSAVADTRAEDALPFGSSDEPTDDLTAVANAVRIDEEPATEAADDERPADDAAAEDEPREEAGTQAREDASADDSAQEQAAAKEPKRRGRKSRGRASVPSWDEIMFGGGKE